MSIATGTKLGQYEVQEFIGQGAMGLVYRAYHAQLERTGAIKVMQAISPDADSVARFRHEAQAIARMRHPNIVDVYDFGEFEGTPYMIVEYVPGGSLANRMLHGRLDKSTALKYLRGIAAALDYAHAHGVVHRDVKPANVLLTAEDTPVIADFGLAKLLQGSSLKSMTGVTTGTPAYMAPEQVTGSQVGPASDRYSLATIAYEMLTGVIPFDGEALMELLYAQVHRLPAAPSARYPDLGGAVDEVIMRGLAKDPAARWESCTAFVDALETALRAPAPARVAARTVVVAPPSFASTAPMARVAPPAKKAPRAMPRTEVIPLPSAVAPTAPMQVATAKPRRWPKRAAIAVAAVMLLVVVLGVCTALTATTLTLNPSTAAWGQEVLVTASHVPAHQPGSIQLHSDVRVFPFTADANGQVNAHIRVPADIPLGDHTVSICWNSSCHASATLRVVAGTGIVLPPGSLTPNPSSTPTPSHGPGATPAPTTPPASGGGGSGGGVPTPKPSTPPPTTNPCPTPSQAAYLTNSPTPPYVAGVTPITITGHNFTPNRTVTLTYSVKNALGQISQKWTRYVTATCAGGFSYTFMAAVTDIGTGYVYATDGSRIGSTNFSLIA